MVIGQDPDAEICLPDEEVARRHASVMHCEDGKLVIHDLGSMNRVLVNGRAVSEAQLKHGDAIELGRTRLLVQALVQAEVDASQNQAVGGDNLLSSRRFPVGLAMNGLLVVSLAVAVIIWHRSTRSNRTSQPVPSPLALDTYLAAAGVSNTLVAPDVTVPLPNAMPENMLAATGLPDAATAIPPPINVSTTLAASTPPVATEELDRIERELAALRVTMQSLSNNHSAASGVVVVASTPIQSTPALQQEPPTHNGTLVPRSKPPEPAVPVAVKFVELRQNKFPATDEFEEMRVVNADLQVRPVNASTKTLRIDVAFFDRLDRDGVIVPSQATITPRSVQAVGEPGAGQCSAGATYVIARRANPDPPRTANYYGFTVRVYDGSRLLAADARPRHLLDEPDASWKPAP